jgi:hypothetical protein
VQRSAGHIGTNFLRGLQSPELWTFCETEDWSHKRVWLSLHYLRLADFRSPPEETGESQDMYGLWAGIRKDLNWTALEHEIRTKALACLRCLQSAEQTATVPKFQCCSCRHKDNFWSDSVEDHNRLVNDNHQPSWVVSNFWHSAEGLIWLAHLGDVRDVPLQDGKLDWRDVRNFAVFFFDWYSTQHFIRDLFAYRINQESLIFVFYDTAHAQLVLGENNNTLHKRSAGRLLCLRPTAGQVQILDSSCGEEFANQLKLASQLGDGLLQKPKK